MYEAPGVYSVKDLTNLQKIGQIIMPRIDFNDSNSISRAELLVKDYSVCGFIIFNGEIEKVRKTICFLQSISEIPLLFGIDAERGLGQMLEGATYFPFLMSQGAINDTEILRKQAEITAKEMLYAGLNLIFAPVLDINSNFHNPIINIRSFGDDPVLVSKLGSTFINEIQKYGIYCCCKHFPGHGSTSEDSHSILPVIKKGLNELLEFDLVPFIFAIENNVAAIMPAHISFPNVDKSHSPATLSETVLTDILRNKLGFNGLVISDSFKMEALNGFGDEVKNAVEALKAGVNIILDPEEPNVLVEKLSGKLGDFEYSLNKSLNKISYYKKFIMSDTDQQNIPNFEKNSEYSNVVSKKAVCKLKGETLKNKKLLIYIFDSDINCCNRFNFFSNYIESHNIRLREKHYRPEISDLSFDTSVLIILSTTVSAWTEKFNLTSEVYHFINGFKNIDNEKILLNFGSPYIAKQFDFFDTVILSFDSTDYCQKAVADVLLGKLNPEGKLSINL